MKRMDFFDAIMESPGLDEIKDVIRKWDRVAQNLLQHEGAEPLVLPDMLWITYPGAGKTTLLRMISDYLDAASLMDFYGDVRFFEFRLEYCLPTQPLGELARLMSDIDQAAGFRNQYRGLLAMDISAWREHFTEPYFLRIMEFVSSLDDHICFIYVLEDADAIEAKQAERILRAYRRVRRVAIPYPTLETFCAFGKRRLAAYGIEIDETAERLLCDSVTELLGSSHFDGYKTINRLCQDIAFEINATERPAGGVVNAGDLKAYHRGGAYIRELCEVTRLRQIGFGGDSI